MYIGYSLDVIKIHVLWWHVRISLLLSSLRRDCGHCRVECNAIYSARQNMSVYYILAESLMYPHWEKSLRLVHSLLESLVCPKMSTLLLVKLTHFHTSESVWVMKVYSTSDIRWLISESARPSFSLSLYIKY